MVKKEFEIDDLVWAKMKNFSPWPARIAQPQGPKFSSAKKPQHFVYFFGTHNFAWIIDKNITPHSKKMLKNSKRYKKMPAALQKAIEEIVEENTEIKPTAMQPVQVITAEKKQPLKRPKRPASETVSQKKSSFKKRRTSSAEVETAGYFHAKILKGPSSLSSTVRSNFKDFQKTKESSDDEVENEPVHILENNATFSNTGFSKIAIIPPLNDDSCAVSHTKPKSIVVRSVLPCPQTQPLDVYTPHENHVKKNIKATTKKIGFLGLGMMGQGMVKNLLNSHHDVTIWNRTKEKCNVFVDAGAKLGYTPSDVVAACDIIFCCVSDPATVKRLVLGNCGVLRGFNESQKGKAYVEMTSVDPATSMEIAEAVIDKGGRYLEAPVVGCRKKAEEGSLIVLCCGDQALFNECESCFSAVAKNAYYLGCDVGTGAKMNLVHSMLTGNMYASLAESIALLNSCKLSVENFLEVLRQNSLNCELIVAKGEAMMTNNYETNTALKHQQKDLALALMLGNREAQPLNMTAAAHELFKRASMLRYSNHDVAALLFGAKI